jgi:hypothetical protein
LRRCCSQHNSKHNGQNDRCRRTAESDHSSAVNHAWLASDLELPSEMTPDKRIDCIQGLSLSAARHARFDVRARQAAFLLRKSL